MVSFRRCILALAVLALFTGLASAQIVIGTNTGSSAGSLQCQASATPTAVRAEGYAELLGDIVIQCTGSTPGGLLAPGSPVPTTNIIVSLNSTQVTSRVFSNGLSEVLLMIDEPGITPGPIGAPATANPQRICDSAAGATVSGCGNLYANTGVNGVSNAAVCTSVSGGICTPGGGFGTIYNVFPGQVSGNQVIFNGIPVLAPVTGGFARTFRITNLRGNANQFANQVGSFQGNALVQASVTFGSVVFLSDPVRTVAYLFNGLSGTSVRNAANTQNGSNGLLLPQCNTAGPTAGAVLRFAEGFGHAFKTRVSATPTYSGASTLAGTTQTTATFTQNSPGAIQANSESGFIFTTAGGTAGLADFGTRLKAVFNNIPTGASIYVSTTNLNPNGSIGNPAATNTQAQYATVQNLPTNNTTTLVAGLVLNESTGTGALGSFLPLAPASSNTSGVSLYGPLVADATGSATVVWEVLNSNPSVAETLEFAVFYAYNVPASAVPAATAGTVSLGFAPTFATPVGTGITAIPRFAPFSNATSIISFAQCKTVLLYPFVSAEPGIDTGIAISNTSMDPYSTRPQSGICSLYFYGANQGATNKVDTPTINAGTMYADSASNLKPGFKGYVIAECNFVLAHGYALLSDTGIRNFATGYLALVLPRGAANRNSENLNYSPTTQVEGLGN